MSSPGVAVWDPQQYERFKRERARPFHDLLARVPDGAVRFAADLGCGTGELTRLLLGRWPGARVFGVDSSAEMLSRAREGAPAERLAFVLADLRAWEPPHPLDRVVSNAALQWVSDHARLLARLVGHLAPGGSLAVQVPNSAAEAAFRILADFVASPRWRDRVPQRLPRIEAPGWYLETLRDAGLEVDLWETVYHHQLPSSNAIVEWMKGTALRPALSQLAAADANAFLAELAARIAPAYPRGRFGVVFPFRRLFFVARRP